MDTVQIEGKTIMIFAICLLARQLGQKSNKFAFTYSLLHCTSSNNWL